MPAILGEIFLGSWNLIKMGFSGLGKFLGSLDAQGIVGLIVAIALAILSAHECGEARHWHKQSDRNQILYNREHRAFGLTVINFRKAQAAAAAKNLAKVAADKAERERITNDISQSYEAELASLRADLANRLHSSPQGTPGSTGLPNVSAAPSGPDGAARVSVPSTLYVHGAELELQLERLQRWVNEQLKVDPNK